jgi:hypothetical protein
MTARTPIIAAFVAAPVAAFAQFAPTTQVRYVESQARSITQYFEATDFAPFDAVAFCEDTSNPHACCPRGRGEQDSQLDSLFSAALLRAEGVSIGGVGSGQSHFEVEFSVSAATPAALIGQFGASGFLVPDYVTVSVRLTGPTGDLVHIEQIGPSVSTQPIQFSGTLDPGDYTLAADVLVDAPSGFNFATRGFTTFVLARCVGDFNFDGVIDLADLSQLLSHFGESDVSYTDGDHNADDLVDLADLAEFLSVFGTPCP